MQSVDGRGGGLGYNRESFDVSGRSGFPRLRRAAFNFAPILAMSEILKLRGAPAFSSSRLARLTDQVRAALPRLKGLAAEHWYFVEVNAPLSAEEQARLVDLLGAHPEGDAPVGSVLVVTPRLGTISPWSSKATDIAHQCGFDKIVRIERGVAYTIDARGVAGNAALAALLHDRMTEAVLDTLDAAEARLIAAGLFAEHRSLVVKIASPDIIHKSDVGGVELELTSPEAVGNATGEVIAWVGSSGNVSSSSGAPTNTLPSGASLTVGCSAQGYLRLALALGLVERFLDAHAARRRGPHRGLRAALLHRRAFQGAHGAVGRSAGALFHLRRGPALPRAHAVLAVVLQHLPRQLIFTTTYANQVQASAWPQGNHLGTSCASPIVFT